MKIKNFKKNTIKHNNNKNYQKNSKNIQYFDKIYINFCNWLVGIQEDDPLPFEIKNIYFIVEFKQNDIVISYSADDKTLISFDYGTYFPIEAQYFFCSELRDLSKQYFVKKSISKQYVFDMLNMLILRAKTELNFLSSKQIFFGERFNKIFV